MEVWSHDRPTTAVRSLLKSVSLEDAVASIFCQAYLVPRRSSIRSCSRIWTRIGAEPPTKGVDNAALPLQNRLSMSCTVMRLPFLIYGVILGFWGFSLFDTFISWATEINGSYTI